MSKLYSEHDIKVIMNVCLLTATEPLTLEKLALAFDNEIELNSIQEILNVLKKEYYNQGLELISTISGFRVRSQINMQNYINKIYKNKNSKYSNALMEILTIIAYKQPITRQEIESIRGVSINNSIIQTLLEKNWIEVVGNKNVIGKPELFATTLQFLNDLNLQSIKDLPQIDNPNNLLIEEKING